MGIPEYLEGVEWQRLCNPETNHGADAEQDAIGSIDRQKMSLHPVPGECQEGATGAITKQGQADYHVGKMMPLDNGKKSHEQDLIRQCGT